MPCDAIAVVAAQIKPEIISKIVGLEGLKRALEVSFKNANKQVTRIDVYASTYVPAYLMVQFQDGSTATIYAKGTIQVRGTARTTQAQLEELKQWLLGQIDIITGAALQLRIKQALEQKNVQVVNQEFNQTNGLGRLTLEVQ
jgi:acetaldehyde dehydrogenase (acetylating)